FCAFCVLVSSLFLSACVSTSGGGGGSGGSIDDTACYLGGLPGSARNDLALSRATPEWKSHQDRMDGLWSSHAGRRNQINGVRRDLAGLGSPPVLCSPFGGPAFLHASALFPGASTYILVGLEGVEAMPDLSGLSAADLDRSLRGIG